MDITASKFEAVINERYGTLRSLPPADFLNSFLQESKTKWQKAIISVDTTIECSLRMDDYCANIIYFRQVLGEMKDISWNIVLDPKNVSLCLKMGHFSDQLRHYVQDRFASRTQKIKKIFEILLARQPSLNVELNDKDLILGGHLHSLKTFDFRSDLESLQIRVSFQLSEHTDSLIGEKVRGIIDDLLHIYWEITPPSSLRPNDAEEAFFIEGGTSYTMHRKAERDPKVIEKAKEIFRSRNDGKLFCEVCGFDFQTIYGDRGRNFAEGHHLTPVSQMKRGEKTKPSDIAILCSNCHSMIHRKPMASPEELRRTMRLSSHQ